MAAQNIRTLKDEIIEEGYELEGYIDGMIRSNNLQQPTEEGKSLLLSLFDLTVDEAKEVLSIFEQNKLDRKVIA